MVERSKDILEPDASRSHLDAKLLCRRLSDTSIPSEPK
jgi:hypothetical protein